MEEGDGDFEVIGPVMSTVNPEYAKRRMKREMTDQLRRQLEFLRRFVSVEPLTGTWPSGTVALVPVDVNLPPEAIERFNVEFRGALDDVLTTLEAGFKTAFDKAWPLRQDSPSEEERDKVWARYLQYILDPIFKDQRRWIQTTDFFTFPVTREHLLWALREYSAALLQEEAEPAHLPHSPNPGDWLRYIRHYGDPSLVTVPLPEDVPAYLEKVIRSRVATVTDGVPLQKERITLAQVAVLYEAQVRRLILWERLLPQRKPEAHAALLTRTLGNDEPAPLAASRNQEPPWWRDDPYPWLTHPFGRWETWVAQAGQGLQEARVLAALKEMTSYGVIVHDLRLDEIEDWEGAGLTRVGTNRPITSTPVLAALFVAPPLFPTAELVALREDIERGRRWFDPATWSGWKREYFSFFRADWEPNAELKRLSKIRELDRELASLDKAIEDTRRTVAIPQSTTLRETPTPPYKAKEPAHLEVRVVPVDGGGAPYEYEWSFRGPESGEKWVVIRTEDDGGAHKSVLETSLAGRYVAHVWPRGRKEAAKVSQEARVRVQRLCKRCRTWFDIEGNEWGACTWRYSPDRSWAPPKAPRSIADIVRDFNRRVAALSLEDRHALYVAWEATPAPPEMLPILGVGQRKTSVDSDAYLPYPLDLQRQPLYGILITLRDPATMELLGLDGPIKGEGDADDTPESPTASEDKRLLNRAWKAMLSFARLHIRVPVEVDVRTMSIDAIDVSPAWRIAIATDDSYYMDHDDFITLFLGPKAPAAPLVPMRRDLIDEYDEHFAWVGAHWARGVEPMPYDAGAKRRGSKPKVIPKGFEALEILWMEDIRKAMGALEAGRPAIFDRAVAHLAQVEAILNGLLSLPTIRWPRGRSLVSFDQLARAFPIFDAEEPKPRSPDHRPSSAIKIEKLQTSMRLNLAQPAARSNQGNTLVPSSRPPSWKNHTNSAFCARTLQFPTYNDPKYWLDVPTN